MLKLLLPAVLIVFPISAQADTLITVDTNAVRMQAYVPDLVVAFGAGSACFDGKIQLDTNASDAIRNRFWATLMTAKVTGKKLSVSYETTSGQCNVTNFILQ